MIGDTAGSGSISTKPCRNIWAQVGEMHEVAGEVNQFVEGRPDIMVKVTDWEKVVC